MLLYKFYSKYLYFCLKVLFYVAFRRYAVSLLSATFVEFHALCFNCCASDVRYITCCRYIRDVLTSGDSDL